MCGILTRLSAASDEQILQYARTLGRVVCTLDADFHSILAVSGAARRVWDEVGDAIGSGAANGQRCAFHSRRDRAGTYLLEPPCGKMSGRHRSREGLVVKIDRRTEGRGAEFRISNVWSGISEWIGGQHLFHPDANDAGA
jgi:hypothetical protein